MTYFHCEERNKWCTHLYDCREQCEPGQRFPERGLDATARPWKHPAPVKMPRRDPEYYKIRPGVPCWYWDK